MTATFARTLRAGWLFVAMLIAMVALSASPALAEVDDDDDAPRRSRHVTSPALAEVDDDDDAPRRSHYVSFYELTSGVGARAFWSAGFTGAGVDVAVVDTGVAGVAGLDGPGKVLHGADVSFDAPYPEYAHRDGFGHGTHMAGIIATNDPAGSRRRLRGIAPDARIVSVKAGDVAGGADVTQVIAAIDWVVEHRSDPGMNIRVLNLSYGTDSTQAHTIDPLAHAIERAWQAGIVVVVSAGNSGATAQPQLASPAHDPFVISVGAVDTKDTSSYGDDEVADFSSRGAGGRNPDLVAPGRSIVSLRVPGSFLDDSHGATARVNDRKFKGSGSSQAAAVVSGAAALVISKHPNATPDQVKALLTSSAHSLGEAPSRQGSGEIDLRAALSTPLPESTQQFAPALGTGSIDAARGTERLVIDDVELRGEIDVFGDALDAPQLASARSAGALWAANSWFGRNFAAGGMPASSSMDTVADADSLWAGRSWSGRSWSGRSWSGRSWSGRSWSGRSWSGRSWSGRSWSGQAVAADAGPGVERGDDDEGYGGARWD